MVEENPVKPFDTSHYDIYTIKEATDVCAIQLNENVEEMLKVTGVEKADWQHHIETYKSGRKNEWKELKYIINGKGAAYPGDWLVWNGSYLQIMYDKDFKEKYKPKRAKEWK